MKSDTDTENLLVQLDSTASLVNGAETAKLQICMHVEEAFAASTEIIIIEVPPTNKAFSGTTGATPTRINIDTVTYSLTMTRKSTSPSPSMTTTTVAITINDATENRDTSWENSILEVTITDTVTTEFMAEDELDFTFENY